MDTRLATTQYRLHQWAEIIKARNASGMKIDEYCKQNNLSRDAYYYWLRKLKKATLQQSGMVEISKPGTLASPDTFHTEMIIARGKFELMVNNDTPSELIARVFEVMERAQ